MEAFTRAAGSLLLVLTLGNACRQDPTEVPPSTITEPGPTATAAPEAASDKYTTDDALPPAEPSPAPQSRRALNVLAIGDSLTDLRSHGGGYLKYLQRRCPRSHFVNLGRGGDMTHQMRRRFEGQVRSIPGKYSHVIVFGGVNDIISDETAHRTNDKIERDLMAMYKRSRDFGARVIAIAVAPWGGFKRYYNARRGRSTRALNAWIAAQVPAAVDLALDPFDLLACGESLCPEHVPPFQDGIHFGKTGHELLGQALFDAEFKNCL